MRMYDRLYVGEKAKKSRAAILQAVREQKPSGYYVLTQASNERNLLDIYPASAFVHPYYEKENPLIVGVAADDRDAAVLAGRIIGDILRKTGGYDVAGYFRKETEQEQS